MTGRGNEYKDAANAAKIAVNAATGNLSGALINASKSSNALLKFLAVFILLPVLIASCLPSIIFGPVFSDDTGNLNGINDSETLYKNTSEVTEVVWYKLNDAQNDCINRICEDFEASDCDTYEIKNMNEVSDDEVYIITSMYCASKSKSVREISVNDLKKLMDKNISQFYTYTYTDSQRSVVSKVNEKTGETETVIIKVRTYEIRLNDDEYLAEYVFNLNESELKLSKGYAESLAALLKYGLWQNANEEYLAGNTVSCEGIEFTDGETKVVYYSQLDERWKDKPYGTDNIGGYGCGPTAMAIAVSSLSGENVDPEHMASWAYENGYWCKGHGSYHSLIPAAAENWCLKCEGASYTEGQKIVNALSKGKLVVAIMSQGHFTSSGHFIVLRGVTREGKILVADPVNLERSNTEWDLDIILNEASRVAGAGGPFWIISK